MSKCYKIDSFIGCGVGEVNIYRVLVFFKHRMNSVQADRTWNQLHLRLFIFAEGNRIEISESLWEEWWWFKASRQALWIKQQTMPLVENWGFSNRKSELWRPAKPYWANPPLSIFGGGHENNVFLWLFKRPFDKRKRWMHCRHLEKTISASPQLRIALTFGQFPESSLPREPKFSTFWPPLAKLTGPWQKPTHLLESCPSQQTKAWYPIFLSNNLCYF